MSFPFVEGFLQLTGICADSSLSPRLGWIAYVATSQGLRVHLLRNFPKPEKPALVFPLSQHAPHHISLPPSAVPLLLGGPSPLGTPVRGPPGDFVKPELSKAFAGLCFRLLEHGQRCRSVPHGEIKALVAGRMQRLLCLIKSRPACVAVPIEGREAVTQR